MATAEPQTSLLLKASLEPYIKPRDQTAHVRRVLALHLGSCLETTQVQPPLSLVEASYSPSASQDARALHREYLQALQANVKAKTDYEKLRQEHSRTGSAASGLPARIATEDRTGDHVAFVKLLRKHQRLQVIQRYLDEVATLPAASEDFLSPELIFKGSSVLPSVPKEVVSGFTVDPSPSKSDLKDLVQKLDRVVLRAKLVLRREEELLQVVKSRLSSSVAHSSDGAKLHALNTTRNELIGWIENELGKAAADGRESADEGDSEQGQEPQSHAGQTLKPASKVSDQLITIKEKYAEYVAARKKLLLVVSQVPQVVSKPPTALEAGVESTPQEGSAEPSFAYLLTPYLENLLAVSREQKSLIVQKSHFNVTMAKQMKETCQMLDHLAEESQLLPSHPMPGSSRAKAGLLDELSVGFSEKPDSTGRVKRWVFAADSAKIATLEAVAEKVEEGQVALEGSMRALHQMNHLLGKVVAEEPKDSRVDTTDDDIWLATGPARKGIEPKRLIEKRKEKQPRPGDIWSALELNLGLLKADDAS